MHEIALAGNARRVMVWIALLASASAQAQDGARATLSVDAPEDCATREAVAAGVRARSARIELVDAAPLALHVALRPVSRAVVSAELRISWPDGRRSQRSLTAPTCVEAADALALLIVLTLDPSSIAQAPPAAAPATQAGSTDAQAAAAPAAEPSAIAPPAAEPASSPPEETPATDASTESAPWSFSHLALGLAFQGLLGPAPRVMPGAVVTAHAAWQGSGLWAPLLQVRLGRSWLTTARDAGRADFELDEARVAACLIGLRNDALAARACASGSVGSLRARGSDTYDPKAHARLWLSAGAELLLTADLIGPLELQAGAGLTMPFFRHRFAFAPEVFHRVAPIAGHGHLGFAVRFP